MSDKNYHPDGFKAMDRGVQSMKEAKGAFNVKEQNPMRPMSFADIQELFEIPLSADDPKSIETLEIVRKIEKFHGIG